MTPKTNQTKIQNIKSHVNRPQIKNQNMTIVKIEKY